MALVLQPTYGSKPPMNTLNCSALSIEYPPRYNTKGSITYCQTDNLLDSVLDHVLEEVRELELIYVIPLPLIYDEWLY